MEFVDILKNKQQFEEHIDIWFKKTLDRVFERMEEENHVEPTFYLMVTINCKPGTVELPVGHVFNLPEGKDRLSHAMKKVCQRRKVLALVFATEAWMAERHIDDKKEIDRLNREGIRNQPDRKECVLINKETESGSEGNFYELIDQGGKRKIGQLLSTSKDTGGRFTNLLYSPKFNN